MAHIVRSKPVIAVACLALLAVVAWADVFTSPGLEFHMFYLVPIVLGAWYVGASFSFLLGVLSAGAAELDFLHSGAPLAPYADADMAMRLVVFVFVAWGIATLRRTNRRLRASEALREDLTHMLVHDLKNPLASGSMALRIFRRKGQASASTAPEDAELLDIVAESHEELGVLIDEMLLIARSERGGGISLALEAADLVAQVRAVTQGVVPRAAERGLELVENYPAGAVTLTLDPPKIRRLVENLLDNALKYTPAGGRVEITVAPEENGARVTVRDTGSGIPRHLQEQIFSRFGQATARQSGARVSVGLGLALCRLVAEAHGGRIWVESEPGRGSAFIFVLPAEPKATKPAAEALTP